MVIAAKERELGDRVSSFLKAELRRRKVGYKELAQRLQDYGLEETDTGIASKLSRGAFSAAFLVACLNVLGIEDVRLRDL